MKCPVCDSYQVRTVDSRPYDDQVRRRRECLACGVRFNTIEIPLLQYKQYRAESHELKMMKGVGKCER